MSGTAAPRRWASLDALRGFDMFWIVGGSAVVAALANATGSSSLAAFERQLHHADWHGFTAWDLVFPLFLFLAGVSLPLSLARRRKAGATRSEIDSHILRRALLLVLLGVVYNIGPQGNFDLRFASVLGRIGLAWAGAALLFVRLRPRGQVLWAAGLLCGYHAALLWIPVPGHGTGNLASGATLTDWFDRSFLPGRLHRGDGDPEGLLSTLPAVTNALFGAWAGLALQRAGRPRRAVVELVLGGGALLALGWFWSLALPLNKNLWTSSFAVFTGGCSALLLGLFVALVDGGMWNGWTRPFVALGRNAITIYLVNRFVPIEAWAKELWSDPLWIASVGLAANLALVVLLDRKRIWLRL